ncbi:MAG TPA: hypothetical protein VHA52_09220 [Candidatus Babeliaceae bacterium]|nr:hypothetical protein [Candidatus Babeliaceae bacterium]
MVARTSNFSNGKPMQNRVPIEKASFSDNFLIQLLTNSPTTQDIEGIVDQHFTAISQSTDIPQLKKIFSEFMKRNVHILSNSQQPRAHAECVFNAYQEAYFAALKEDRIFQKKLEEEKSKFSFFTPSTIENAIKSFVLSRVETMYSMVPALVLEELFLLPEYSLKFYEFRDQFTAPSANISNLSQFFERYITKS